MDEERRSGADPETRGRAVGPAGQPSSVGTKVVAPPQWPQTHEQTWEGLLSPGTKDLDQGGGRGLLVRGAARHPILHFTAAGLVQEAGALPPVCLQFFNHDIRPCFPPTWRLFSTHLLMASIMCSLMQIQPFFFNTFSAHLLSD